MAVTALVLGILSILFTFIPIPVVANLLGIVMGIVGIILGSLGKKNPEKASMATAGLVCSIIGLALNIIGWIACAACVGGMAELGNSL